LNILAERAEKAAAEAKKQEEADAKAKKEADKAARIVSFFNLRTHNRIHWSLLKLFSLTILVQYTN
jgi:hypothetical protein